MLNFWPIGREISYVQVFSHPPSPPCTNNLTIYTLLIWCLTGVGVDIKVNNAVIFGLPETAENLLQEGGRPMRGSQQETLGKQGFAFFFHKGSLGKGNKVWWILLCRVPFPNGVLILNILSSLFRSKLVICYDIFQPYPKVIKSQSPISTARWHLSWQHSSISGILSKPQLHSSSN